MGVLLSESMCLELDLLSEMRPVVNDNNGKTLLDDINAMQLELI